MLVKDVGEGILDIFDPSYMLTKLNLTAITLFQKMYQPASA